MALWPFDNLFCHESELWKSKAGVLVYKDRGGLKIDLATGQNWFIKGKGPSPPPPEKIDRINMTPPPHGIDLIERELIWGGGGAESWTVPDYATSTYYDIWVLYTS